jgi:hypothetical protein
MTQVTQRQRAAEKEIRKDTPADLPISICIEATQASQPGKADVRELAL